MPPSCNPYPCTGPEWRSTPRRSSATPPLQILPVADLLDHAAHPLVGVDGDQEIVGGDRRGLAAGGHVMHLGLESAADDLGQVSAAHPTHHGEDLAVVDGLEELLLGVALGPGAQDLENLLLG